MNAWFQTAAVILLAAAGVVLGLLCTRLRKPYWAAGYLLALVLVIILVAIRCNHSIAFIPPFSWVAAGRTRFVLLSLTVTMGLATTIPRLPRKWERIAITAVMFALVVYFSVLPFLVPAFVKNQLAELPTHISLNGVCFQTTSYTCAPAASVTALKTLGLPAREGEIAVLAHSTPLTGTLPRCLCSALKKRYAADGLQCRYRRFRSVNELKDADATLAVVKDSLFGDHCVAVLDVSDRTVTVADPVTGKQLMTHSQFEKVWRFAGIILTRNSPHSI